MSPATRNTATALSLLLYLCVFHCMSSSAALSRNSFVLILLCHGKENWKTVSSLYAKFVVAAACVLKVLVFRAHWPLTMEAAGFLETAGCVKFFLSFFISFLSFSHNFVSLDLSLYYHCFSYPLLLMSSLRFALFIYLFISLSFSLLYLSVLYLLYTFTFVIFFIFWISYF